MPKRNETVAATTTPQLFEVLLTVRGDGAPLDEGSVYFLVPASGS